MLYIDRTSVTPPKSLFSKRVELEINRMKEFYNPLVSKKQLQYEYKTQLINNSDVINQCRLLFHNKCAYCESPVNGHPSAIDHFRPKRHAMNMDGKVDNDYYWWLTYEWSNLYLSCSKCNHSKKTRFPVKGKRISFEQSVSEEHYLLLDPCNKSDFDEPHFYSNEDGVMVGITNRGEITIDILNLNRKQLIEERKSVIDKVHQLLREVSTLKIPNDLYTNIKNRLLKIIAIDAPYSSVALHYITAFSEKTTKVRNRKLFDQLIAELTTKDNTSLIDWFKSDISKNIHTQQVSQKNISYTMDLDSKEEKVAYFASSKKILKIEINNFKVIKSLTLAFPNTRTEEESWLVLLGENGTGKSTVLQAVALTLAGEDRANALGMDASKFVNRNTRSKNGYVKVYLEGINKPLELHFNSSSSKFTSSFHDSKVIVLAFGSTRLMANDQSLAKKNNNVRNLRNLFDPFASLPDAEEWLSDPRQVKVKQFDRIAFELKKLLSLPEDRLIYRRKNKHGNYELFIKLNENRKGVQIRELSAGYQAIIVLALNIIREVLQTWSNFSIAEGIVLIDEIGVHLHPKWKLQIISTLRDIFPMMNFVITTHEPLCLRGINEGEVALMKTDEEGQIIALTDLPSPKGLTIEQLITSKFFGLITSFDPEIEAQLNAFYLLNSKRDLNDQESVQLETLRAELENMNVIDEKENLEAAQKPRFNLDNSPLDAGWITNPKHQDNLKERLKDIWNKKTI